MTSPWAAEQFDRLAQKQKDPRVAFAMSGLTVTLLCVMALKEIKGLFREERGRGR